MQNGYFSFLITDHGAIKNFYINGLPFAIYENGAIRILEKLPPLPVDLERLAKHLRTLVNELAVKTEPVDELS